MNLIIDKATIILENRMFKEDCVPTNLFYPKYGAFANKYLKKIFVK